jgi:uncharacterized protein YhdP
LTTKAVIIVVLAALQGVVLAALPMVNYWRTDIEELLSERLNARVTVSEIGARLSWTGPYLEAVNIVMRRETESLEVRRVQILLDLPATIVAMEPVIGEFVLDEGEIVQGLSDGSEIPDPFIWAQLLTKLHESIRTVGAFKIQNFDMLLGDVSLKQLSLEITPDLGVIAKARVVTEDVSIPLEVDWRYPSADQQSHEVRIHTRLQNAPISMVGLDRLSVALEATSWLTIRDGRPVEGIARITGLAESDQGLSGDSKVRFELTGLSSARASFDSLQLQLPGLKVAGTGGGFHFDGERLLAQVPSVDLEAEPLSAFLKTLDLDLKLIRFLSLNKPAFRASNLELDWHLDEAPLVHADVDSFEIQAARSIPGVGPVSGELFLHGSSGWFHFHSKAAMFSLPEVFDEPWTDQSLTGVLAFNQTDEGLVIMGHDLKVRDDVQNVTGALLLDLPHDREQQMQLEMTVKASTRALRGLLPSVLNSEVTAFLNQTIEKVAVENGRISYSAPLGANVDETRGELAMRFPLESYRFKPLADWPAFVGRAGMVDFADRRAHVEFQKSEFGGLFVNRVVAWQPSAYGSQINIRGDLLGEASRALQILDAAGVKPDAFRSSMTLEGTLKGDVHLEIPIGQRPAGYVVVETQDLSVTWEDLSEPITQIKGRAKYRLNKGLYTDVLAGQLLGDPVEARITVLDGVTDITGKGRIRSINFSKLAQLGLTEKQFFGSGEWSFNASVRDDSSFLMLETNGIGIGSALPYPLDKDPDTIGRININLSSKPSGPSLAAELFEIAEIRGVLDTTPLALEVITPRIDLIGWATFPSLGTDLGNISLLLRTDQLLLGDTPLAVRETAINLRPQEFNVSFDGAELAGLISRVGDAPLSIDLERLLLPEGGRLLDPSGEDPLLDYNPGKLPSANVRISNLLRGEIRYQDFSAVLVSGESRIDATTLEFDREDQHFQGEFAWAYQDGQAKSALLLRARGDQLGNILRVNEDDPILEAEDGRFVSNLSWRGSPLGFSLLESQGTVELSLKKGRFLDLGNSAEVLRLFGILNIDTITRRLRLDFLDLVQPGVAFDGVNAKAKIADGALIFDPEFTMRGPSASFRLTGRADLVNKELNQKLEVDIPLTNNLPLASVLLGAPQVGGAIYLVEKALGTKIIKVGKTDYRIEGSFDDPQVSLIPPFVK